MRRSPWWLLGEEIWEAHQCIAIDQRELGLHETVVCKTLSVIICMVAHSMRLVKERSASPWGLHILGHSMATTCGLR